MVVKAKTKKGAAPRKAKKGARTLSAAFARLAKLENNVAAWWDEIGKIRREFTTAADIARIERKVNARFNLIGRQIEEAGKRFDKASAKLDNVCKRFGDFSNAEGDIFEIECRAALEEAGELGGIRLDKVVGSVAGYYEYDAVGINGKCVVAAEIKRTLRADDVLGFANVRLPAFADEQPKYAKGRDVFGAVIFRRAPKRKLKNGKTEDPVQIALDNGLMVVQAVGKNYRMKVVTSAKDVRR